MELNISQTNSFLFENKSNLKNTAKDIFQRQGKNLPTAEELAEKSVFSVQNSDDLHLSLVKSSYQMDMNDKLKETLQYLKQHNAKRTEKKPVLGEIWDLYSNQKETEYTGELVDFVIDETRINIFAA